jgi:hypothetical protein
VRVGEQGGGVVGNTRRTDDVPSSCIFIILYGVFLMYGVYVVYIYYVWLIVSLLETADSALSVCCVSVIPIPELYLPASPWRYHTDTIRIYQTIGMSGRVRIRMVLYTDIDPRDSNAELIFNCMLYSLYRRSI